MNFEKIKILIKISRLDHFIKHLFIIPGIFFAVLLVPKNDLNLINCILGFLSSFLIASSNYAMNEYLDKDYDKYHPKKKIRPLVNGNIISKNILFYCLSLYVISLIISSFINIFFFYASFAFIFSALVYNIKPFRFKDIVYLDVIVESLNNPIRFFLGWFMVIDKFFLPPISILLVYWLAGAFLMASKRLSEIRFFKKYSNLSNLIKYRKNYQKYNETNLLISCLFYLMLLSFFIAIFLVKYRAELILLYPFVSLIFCYYLYLSLETINSKISPDKVYLNTKLIFLIVFISFIFIISMKYDLNFIRLIVNKTIEVDIN